MTNWNSCRKAKKPLLIIVDSHDTRNAYGPFMSEILTTEGFPYYDVVDLKELTASQLECYPLAILTHCLVTDGKQYMDDASPAFQVPDQVSLFENYVRRAGRLIALRPTSRLARVFGVQPCSSLQMGGHLHVREVRELSVGYAGEFLQVHGVVDHFLPDGAEIVADLMDREGNETPWIGASINRYGEGQAALFPYDLCRSVALARQGNPALADVRSWELKGLDRDIWEIVPFRPWSLFYEWSTDVSIPYADMQQRMFSRLVEWMAKDVVTLPRVWYFPQAASGIVVQSADEDKATMAEKEHLFALAEKYRTHLTVFVMADDFLNQKQGSAAQYNTDTLIQGWMSRGHSFGIHPYVSAARGSAYRRAIDELLRQFENHYKVTPSKTVRTHYASWLGYTELAEIFEKAGLVMDNTYLSLPGATYMTGSGLPMRFINQQGRLTNVYQQPCHLGEDCMAFEFESLALQRTKDFLLRGIERWSSAVTLYVHPRDYVSGSKEWYEGLLKCCRENDIQILSIDEWFNFWTAREHLSFELTSEEPEGWSLNIRNNSPVQVQDLALLFPVWSENADGEKGLSVNGRRCRLRESELLGMPYLVLLLDLKAGQSAEVKNA